MKTKDIAIIAAIMALMVVFSFFSFVWAVPLIVGSIVVGKKKAFILSLTLGVISLVQSYLNGGTFFVFGAFIAFPWVPIVARIFVGSSAALVYDLLKKRNAPLGATLGAVTASIVNTVCVMGILALLAVSDMLNMGDFLLFASAEVFLHAIVEIVVNAAMVPAILFAIDKATNSHYITKQKS